MAEQNDFRKQVVDAVSQAFREGAGNVQISSATEREMRAYWERCFDMNVGEIEQQWKNGGEKMAVDKVRLMGQSAAGATESKVASSELEMKEFHDAREKINSGANGTGWCREPA